MNAGVLGGHANMGGYKGPPWLHASNMAAAVCALEEKKGSPLLELCC